MVPWCAFFYLQTPLAPMVQRCSRNAANQKIQRSQKTLQIVSYPQKLCRRKTNKFLHFNRFFVIPEIFSETEKIQNLNLKPKKLFIFFMEAIFCEIRFFKIIWIKIFFFLIEFSFVISISLPTDLLRNGFCFQPRAILEIKKFIQSYHITHQ